MPLLPRESGEFIVKNSKYIKVHENGIKNLSNEVLEGIKLKKITVENFSQHEHHPNPENKNAIDWIFLVDTLNFCFWTAGNDVKWRVNNNTGYFALCAAVNRAIKDGIDITNPEYYRKITLDEIKHILRPDDCITSVPLLEERVQCLHEVGEKLIEKYNGTFENCLKTCNNSAQNLLKTIVTEFPCYRDEALFAGEKVSLYKRAQILIGDIWSCFRGTGYGKFNDIDTITMFADYRVPQVLVHFGALEYSKELLDILKDNKLLKNGDEREIEIRGASIYIVEELKKYILNEIHTKYPEISKDNVNSILLDHFLWDYRRRFAKELEYIPFHKVLSIYY